MHNIKSIILQSTSYLKAKKKNLKIKSSEVYLTEKATLEIGSGREGTYRTKEVPKTYTAAPPTSVLPEVLEWSLCCPAGTLLWCCISGHFWCLSSARAASSHLPSASTRNLWWEGLAEQEQGAGAMAMVWVSSFLIDWELTWAVTGRLVDPEALSLPSPVLRSLCCWERIPGYE